MPRKILLITNIGAVWRRVLDVIYNIMPQSLVMFHQEKEGWNEKNKQYKAQVLDKFFSDPLIISFQQREMLHEEPIETCLKYECIFGRLYEIVKKYGTDCEEIYIDTTGMSKEATTAALNLASCFQNVSVIYLRAKGSDRYIPEKFDKWADQEGMKEHTLLPAPRIDLTSLTQPGSLKPILLKALLKTQEKHGKKFYYKDFYQVLQDMSTEVPQMKQKPPKDFKKSVGTNVELLEKDGFIKITLISRSSKEIELTRFGMCLAAVLCD